MWLLAQATRFGKLPEEIEEADGALLRMLEIETVVLNAQKAMRQ